MVRKKKRCWKWTKEAIINEAKKYEYRSDFKKAEPNLYKKICQEGYFNEAFGHMKHKPKKWTKEECLKAASKCKTKSEFEKKFCGAYSSSRKNGWYEECVSAFFTLVGNKANRCIYAFEFDDGSVYVGLTFNFEERKKQHHKDPDSTVFKHVSKTGAKYNAIQKTDYIDYRSASTLEGIILKEYIDGGWIPLNRVKTGGLGSSVEKKEKPEKHKRLAWTYELLYEEAKKYNTKKDFFEQSPSAYSSAHKMGIINEVCSHMTPLKKLKWAFEEAREVALLYDNKKDFRKEHPGLYSVCQQNGWIPKVCSHMRNLYDEKIIYNENVVKETLGKYEKMQQLRTSEDKFVRGCYWWIKHKKLLNEYKKYLKNVND